MAEVNVGDKVFLVQDVERMKRKFRGDSAGFAAASKRLRPYMVKAVSGNGEVTATHGAQRVVCYANQLVKPSKPVAKKATKKKASE